MTRLLRTALLAATVTVALAAAPAGAQDPGPSATPMPFEAYLARLEELGEASDAVLADRAPTTPAEFASAFGEILVLGAADLVGLRQISPQPCYAAAHEEIIAYRESVIEVIEPFLSLMAEAETLEDLSGPIDRIDAELFARHPTAYLDPPEAQPGFGGSHRHILTALVTCEGASIFDPTAGLQRFEFADEGVAISLASEWEPIDPEIVGHDEYLGFYASDRHGACAVVKISDVSATIDDVLEFLIPNGYWVDLPGGYSSDGVETAAGPTARVAYWEQADDGTRSRNAIYFVPTTQGLYSVQCVAEEGLYVAPDDDWYSVAQDFELLGTDELATDDEAEGNAVEPDL